jgi:hypothetical protein
MERAASQPLDSSISKVANAGEMFLMTTTSVPLRSVASARSRALPEIVRDRRRRIDPASGRALEILGHAIEYLADEHAHRGGSLSAEDPLVSAMQILMECNREIYFACPVVPTLGARWRALLSPPIV